jgi:hypothetical protein
MLSRQFRTFNLEAFSLKTSDNGGLLSQEETHEIVAKQ